MFTMLVLASLVEAEPRMDCRNPTTQMEITICSGEEFERTDAELNQIWRLVTAKLKLWDIAPYRKRSELTTLFPGMLAAQRAWLRYRAEQCTFEGLFSAEGGSAQGSFVSICRTRLTKARIAELRRVVQD